MNPDELLLEQWKTASELHRHMDNVSWQRFNFFMATNGVLLAGLAAVAASDAFKADPGPCLLHVVTIAIPIIGSVLSLVAFLVQRRGQAYHYFRCRQAREAEEELEKIKGKRLLCLYEKSLPGLRTHTLIAAVAVFFLIVWIVVFTFSVSSYFCRPARPAETAAQPVAAADVLPRRLVGVR